MYGVGDRWVGFLTRDPSTKPNAFARRATRSKGLGVPDISMIWLFTEYTDLEINSFLNLFC